VATSKRKCVTYKVAGHLAPFFRRGWPEGPGVVLGFRNLQPPPPLAAPPSKEGGLCGLRPVLMILVKVYFRRNRGKPPVLMILVKVYFRRNRGNPLGFDTLDKSVYNSNRKDSHMKTIVNFFPALKYFNVPNVITTMGLIFGIAAVYFLVAENLRTAIICLLAAAICDLVDGFFATKLNQQSRFGQAMDSLVDFFICVIMPVWIVHAFIGDNLLARIGLAFYCICGLWRLAYYMVNEADKSFTGLPVPSAMMLVTMATWAIVYMGFPEWTLTATFFVTGILMLSYFRLKKYGKWQVIMAGIGLAFFIIVLVTWLVL